MGILDKFKRKKEANEPPQQEVQGENSEAPGWDAISEAFDALYPGQENPRHYGTLIKWRLGGNDPLDGISIYDGGDYWHFITYGLSEIYEKETDEPEISGYGMEFTFKLEKGSYEDEEAEIKGICSILQSLARITFTKGELFHAYELQHYRLYYDSRAKDREDRHAEWSRRFCGIYRRYQRGTSNCQGKGPLRQGTLPTIGY